MPDYQKGKIYKIVSDDLVYIGSTCEPTLARRLSGHVRNYKYWKEGKHTFTTAFLLIETEKYDISLIESVPCQSKDELHARERFWIETTTCVNRQIPGRTYNEWRIDKADKLKQQRKEWKEANVDKQKEWRKAYNEKNHEKLKAQWTAYNQTHREEQREHARKKREGNNLLKVD